MVATSKKMYDRTASDESINGQSDPFGGYSLHKSYHFFSWFQIATLSHHPFSANLIIAWNLSQELETVP